MKYIVKQTSNLSSKIAQKQAKTWLYVLKHQSKNIFALKIRHFDNEEQEC